MSERKVIAEGINYIEQLGWSLTVVRGGGETPKAPLHRGWPDLQLSAEALRHILDHNHDAGIGLNLGESGLIDLEGDTPEGEAILDDLCKGLVLPCWQSRKSKHRLFQAHPDISMLRVIPSEIEFRTGRHQSVLPPTVIGETAYQWLVSPFDVQPPPLPQNILAFYEEERKRPGNHLEPRPSPPKQRLPFKDNNDYILKHFDLMEEADAAGLVFSCPSPHSNGNIPCYVPDGLRDGNPDENPSGVFNIHNGVLRDFATGKRHRFPDVLAALTGKDWKDVLASLEAKAGAVSGRPHSRRISFPSAATSENPRASLQSVRANLESYYEDQLNRPPRPKTFHLIKGPPGVGKTYTICKTVAEKDTKAIILTLENELAKTHDQLLNDGGGHACRMPVLGEVDCPYPNDYRKMTRRGFKPSQSLPCRKCQIGPKNCPYLLGFSSLADGDQLCAAAIYHTHDNFYSSHGNENRPIVVFDENCFDFILEGVGNSIDQWNNWAHMLSDWNGKKHPYIVPFIALVEWMNEIKEKFSKLVDEEDNPKKFNLYSVPDNLHILDLAKLPNLEKWLNTHAHKELYRTIQNLYGFAIYLLRTPGSHVLLERISRKDGEVINVRFRKRNPLPEDKEIFLLDATANEDMLRAIAPDWDIQKWECPPIEQKGRVVQIMDYDLSRNRIKKEVAKHSENNPSWLVQVLDNILEQYGPAGIISFKDVVVDPQPEQDILGLLKHGHLITSRRNFPCRGHTFDDKALIVMGTPYKDEATVWEMAMAIWGEEGCPNSSYIHRKQRNGDFISRNMGYEENHLLAIRQFVVFADIVQAIGRVRPLQNESLVFVISNANIWDWEVEQYMAEELFKIRQPLRKDAADRYDHYVATAMELLDENNCTKNAEVCEALGMPERTGGRYWKRLCAVPPNDVIVSNGTMRRKREIRRKRRELEILEL